MVITIYRELEEICGRYMYPHIERFMEKYTFMMSPLFLSVVCSVSRMLFVPITNCRKVCTSPFLKAMFMGLPSDVTISSTHFIIPDSPTSGTLTWEIKKETEMKVPIVVVRSTTAYVLPMLCGDESQINMEQLNRSKLLSY